ncbi:MAG: GNAT family N-acetyltransferase [Pseudomonadota bacterium]
MPDSIDRHGAVDAATALGRVHLNEIAAVFNLIQDGSADGCFNDIYLQPRYQAGLGGQLLCVWGLGRIRLPDGRWSQAALRVVRRDGALAGFILTRDPAPGRREIYMCAVDSQWRRRGLGRLLVCAAQASLAPGTTLEAHCRTPALAMRRLLQSAGFAPQKPGAGGVRGFVYRA